MPLPPLTLIDDAAYAIELLGREKAVVAALGTPEFLQPVIDREDEHLIIGKSLPESGSWDDFDEYYGFLRTVPDLVLVDWSLFSGPIDEWKRLVDILTLALDTGHTVAIVVRDAATDELEFPAHAIEFLLGHAPEIYHREL